MSRFVSVQIVSSAQQPSRWLCRGRARGSLALLLDSASPLEQENDEYEWFWLAVSPCKEFKSKSNIYNNKSSLSGAKSFEFILQKLYKTQ